MESRYVDTTEVRCEDCGWQGQGKDCTHGYAQVGMSDEVEPMDYCPQCGSENLIDRLKPSSKFNQWMYDRIEEERKDPNYLPSGLSAAITAQLNADGIPYNQATGTALSIGYWSGYLWGKYPEEMKKMLEEE